MPRVYLYDEVSKKFVSQIECQLDPLTSEIEGHDVFLTPANTTPIEPLEEKEGFDIIWNGESWEYKEGKKPEEPEPYEPTEYEIALNNMWNAKHKLSDTDYINDKINDALNTGNTEFAEELRQKYAPIFAEREQYRTEVRKWESEVKRLKPVKTIE